MTPRAQRVGISLLLLFVSLIFPPCALIGQSANGTISGIVTDPSNAVIPSAEVTLTRVVSGTEVKTTVGSNGFYSFPNLTVGDYQLRCTAKGFSTYIQVGITVQLNQTIQIPIQLKLGSTSETVNVSADASPLNFENAVVKEGIPNLQLEQLPIIVEGGQRSAANFVKILPGVSTEGTPLTNVTNTITTFNGNQNMSEEAVLDGVSMMEGLLSQTGMVALGSDFPISPEAVGEINVLTSNYDPQYGATTGAVIVASTKAGTDNYHGGAYEFNRNTDFNARPFGVFSRPEDIENDGGAYVGGPLKFLPGFRSTNRKSYFFINFEIYRSVGATTKPLLTVPTSQMRNGDFSQWPYPIYDPTTTMANPSYNPSLPTSATNLQYLRQQFPGNIIPQSAMVGSLAQDWLKYVPEPNRSGLTANWEAPNGLASALNANTNQWDVRGDQNLGDKDHITITYHYRGTLPFTQHAFPAVIDTNNTRIPNYSNVARVNYDHTFTPRLLNHLSGGYLNLLTAAYNSSDCCVTQVPQIAGVYNHTHEPAITFQTGEYSPYGGNADFRTTRPTWIVNDMLSWVHGSHTFSFGGEFRKFGYPTNQTPNGSGTFNFSDLNTGLLGIQSGNSMASFMIGGVASSSTEFFSLPIFDPTAISVGLFAGDTWRATRKLSVDYGIRWDLFQPSKEAHDQTSFFDPNAENPGAGNRLGALVFAGNKWGSASFGARYPENLYRGAFGPRVGIAYAITQKSVIRAGYGIFYMQNFYPGWNGGIATDGFNKTVAFDSTLGGLQPAFLLQNGLPQNFQKPPVIDRSYLNGQGAPNYRPFNANEEPHSQQWNLSVEHQFTDNFHVTVAYVANHGSRLLSAMAPINSLSPALLSMGGALFDQFAPGQVSLDGVAAPYPGWAAQMTGCPPTVAQALQLYPQYCGNIGGQNENLGWSNYNSLQASAEKRLSNGLWFDVNYTWSKWLSTSDTAQTSQQVSPISPYQLDRNYSNSAFSIPQIFNASVTYNLPFGKGQRFVNQGGITNVLIGGWQISTILTLQNGLPFNFTSTSFCNVPSQFAAGCIPATLPGANPYANSKSGYNPVKGPLFNLNAFQPASTFNFNFGDGPRVSNLRGFGYRDEDFSLAKTINISDRLTAQLRGDFFNVYNWHNFSEPGSFVNDISSPTFGAWTGSVTAPRNLQVGVHLTF
jgi:Carboxypeptidase regulatory-like domain